VLNPHVPDVAQIWADTMLLSRECLKLVGHLRTFCLLFYKFGHITHFTDCFVFFWFLFMKVCMDTGAQYYL